MLYWRVLKRTKYADINAILRDTINTNHAVSSRDSCSTSLSTKRHKKWFNHSGSVTTQQKLDLIGCTAILNVFVFKLKRLLISLLLLKFCCWTIVWHKLRFFFTLTLHVLGTHQPTLSGHHETLLMIKICLNNTQHLDLRFEHILVSFPEWWAYHCLRQFGRQTQLSYLWDNHN